MHTPSLTPRLRSMQVKSRQTLRFFFFKCIGVGLLFGVLAIACVLLYSRFRVRHILCSVAGKPCVQDTLDTYQKFYGVSMFSTSLNVENSQGIIRKKYPDTLIVTMKSPIAIFSGIRSTSGTLYTLYEDGHVSEGASSSATYQIEDVHFNSLKSGFIDTETLSFYLNLKHENNISLPGLEKISIIGDDRVEWVFDTHMTAVTDRQHVLEQTRSLQYLLQTPTIDLRFHTVDLRFVNPVVE